MDAIEIIGFEKRYGTGFFKHRVKIGLQSLTLSVKQGEIFGCLGPNGAGKTTTLKLLMGLVKPSAGTAKIQGKHWLDADVRARIGFLPEQPYFYDHLTARELLRYLATLSGMPANRVEARIQEVLELVGMSESSSLQLRKLSKGMLQRVGIAQSIIHDPEILFLDEPMSGMDPIGRREIRDLIVSLRQRGKTIFFSTHILSDAEALCDRVAVLYKGELRGVGVVSELRMQKSTRIEVTFEGPDLDATAVSLCDSYSRTSNAVRAEIQESRLDQLLAAIRKAGARLISVNPEYGALEEYFFQAVKPAAPGTQ